MSPKPLHLGDQDLWIYHDPVADRTGLSRVEDSRGDQVELEDLPVTDDGVAGVVSALEADHDIGSLGEQVRDLPLSFVTPLGADYYETWHES